MPTPLVQIDTRRSAAPADRLADPVTIAVVGVGDHAASLGDGLQPVGGVVGIGRRAIAGQVAEGIVGVALRRLEAIAAAAVVVSKQAVSSWLAPL